MCDWLKRKQQEIGILTTEQPKTTKMERNVYKTTIVSPQEYTCNTHYQLLITVAMKFTPLHY